MCLCIICRTSVPIDDIAILAVSGRGACVPCFARATGTSRALPRAPRNQASAVLTLA